MVSGSKTAFAFFISVLFVLAALYIHTLTTLQTEDIRINDVERINTDGFSFQGSLDITNNGLLPARIYGVAYNVTNNDDEELAYGEAPHFTVERGVTETINFSMNGSWQRSLPAIAEAAIDMNTTIHITADVTVLPPPISLKRTKTTTTSLTDTPSNTGSSDNDASQTNTSDNALAVTPDEAVPDLSIS